MTTMEDAYRFGKAVILSGMAPRGYQKPEQVVIAVQYGAEVGLSPMQSLQSITVINGRPTLWGDSLPALVHASGKCESIQEHIDGEGDEMRAVCEVKRAGHPESCTRTFSVADAKTAGLWGKSGPWTNYPKRMLQIRARAWAFRDTFADVLCGFGVTEEIQDIGETEPQRLDFVREACTQLERCRDHVEVESLMGKIEGAEPPLSDDELDEIRMYSERKKTALSEEILQ